MIYLQKHWLIIRRIQYIRYYTMYSRFSSWIVFHPEVRKKNLSYYDIVKKISFFFKYYNMYKIAKKALQQVLVLPKLFKCSIVKTPWEEQQINYLRT